MGIAEHIESLLYRYQCVVVPSFGAFLTQIKPAYLQKDSNTFYPPSKELSFNAQLKSNDGLLVSHISQSDHKNYDEVLSGIEAQAKAWFKTLYSEGSLDFGALGVFKLNAERKIVFQPADKNNYLAASFGLSGVHASPVTREMLKEEVVEMEERIPFMITPETRKEFGLRPYFKYAAVVLLALTTGLSAFTYYQRHNASDALVREAAQQEVSRHIQEATFFSTSPLELPSIHLDVTRTRKGSHHIIAGAFRVRENADKKIRQLRDRGYDALYIGVNAYGLHQVAYGSYSDPAEALEALHKIKRTVSADAWLLSVK